MDHGLYEGFNISLINFKWSYPENGFCGTGGSGLGFEVSWLLTDWLLTGWLLDCGWATGVPVLTVEDACVGGQCLWPTTGLLKYRVEWHNSPGWGFCWECFRSKLESWSLLVEGWTQCFEGKRSAKDRRKWALGFFSFFFFGFFVFFLFIISSLHLGEGIIFFFFWLVI